MALPFLSFFTCYRYPYLNIREAIRITTYEFDFSIRLEDRTTLKQPNVDQDRSTSLDTEAHIRTVISHHHLGVLELEGDGGNACEGFPENPSPPFILSLDPNRRVGQRRKGSKAKPSRTKISGSSWIQTWRLKKIVIWAH